MALSQDDIRRFEGTRFSLNEVTVHGLPLAMWLTMPRRRPQVHAFLADRGGTGGRTVFHGSDDAGLKMLVLQHFQRVTKPLREVLGNGSAPLARAGARSMQALYHKANTYPEFLAAGLDGSPRDLSLEELHRRASPLVEPVLRSNEAVAAAHTAHCKAPGAPAMSQPGCSPRPNRDGSKPCSCQPTHPNGTPASIPGR